MNFLHNLTRQSLKSMFIYIDKAYTRCVTVFTVETISIVYWTFFCFTTYGKLRAPNRIAHALNSRPLINDEEIYEDIKSGFNIGSSAEI